MTGKAVAVIRCLTFYLIIPKFNSLPNDKNLARSKVKEFADDKIKEPEMMIYAFDRIENHNGKRRKCWLPPFFPFTKLFSKGFLYRNVKSLDCVLKG